jgi:hypothetical protein
MNDIQEAVDRVKTFDVAFEPTGIYVGEFGPALTAIIGRGDFVFGPDSPVVEMRLDVIFRGLDVTNALFATALDALAAAVCPRPTAKETAVEYVARLKANYAILVYLFNEGR